MGKGHGFPLINIFSFPIAKFRPLIISKKVAGGTCMYVSEEVETPARMVLPLASLLLLEDAKVSPASILLESPAMVCATAACWHG